jgi:hypothetical protein
MPDRPVAPGATHWTPAAAAARAAEVLRREGVRALVARAAGEIAYRRLFLFERDPAGPASNVDCGAELSFGFVARDQLDAYERLRPGSRPRAEARLNSGSRCFGTWLGGELVAARWLASGSPYIEYLAAELPLGDAEVYTYDSFTGAEHRRQSISTVSQDRLADLLRGEGAERMLRAILPENRAGIRDAAKANFVRRGRIAVLGRGRARRVFIRRT